MSDSTPKEELGEKYKTLSESLVSGKDPTATDSVTAYEIIVAGGENKKSVEHILLPAILPKEKNVLERLWSAIFSRQSSNNRHSNTNEAHAIRKWNYRKPMRIKREAFMAVIYQDQMFAFGGRSSNRIMENLELNNPRARWQCQGEIFPEYMSESTAVVYGDSAYIFGGGFGSAPSTNIYRLMHQFM